jgi:hypothetical protein
MKHSNLPNPTSPTRLDVRHKSAIGAKADTRLNRRQTLLGPAALVMSNMLAPNQASAQSPPEGEVRAIAKEATIYGFPLVDSYRIQYSYFVDRNDPEFKGNWNELHNTARVYTPDVERAAACTHTRTTCGAVHEEPPP